MRHLLHRLWGIVLVLPILLLPGLAVAQTSAPTLEPVQSSVEAGQAIEFMAGGFEPGERITTWATSPSQAVLSGDYFVFSDSGARTKLVFFTPGDAIGGRWAYTAYGESSRRQAVAFFTVVGGTATAAEPQAAIAPIVGPPGTSFSFAATGFKKNELVSYWFTSPTGSVFAAYPAELEASEKGRVDFTWTAPSNAPRGFWAVTIQGVKSGIARGVPFEIR